MGAGDCLYLSSATVDGACLSSPGANLGTGSAADFNAVQCRFAMDLLVPAAGIRRRLITS
ncbi:hypothetical protein D3C73_1428700 [compost metagenome]